MREIKFRAWDKTINQMMDVYSVLHCEGGIRVGGMGVSIGNGWATEENGWKHECDAALMQYTGLRDKNGEKIYEGDIVKTRGFRPDTFEIVFDRGGFCLKHGDDGYYPDIKYAEDEHGEVVGNIYQNKNLLT